MERICSKRCKAAINSAGTLTMKRKEITMENETTKETFMQFVERIERLERDKQDFVDGIREVYKDAKGMGYDTKAMRTIIKLRKMDPAQRAESEYLRESYKNLAGIED